MDSYMFPINRHGKLVFSSYLYPKSNFQITDPKTPTPPPADPRPSRPRAHQPDPSPPAPVQILTRPAQPDPSPPPPVHIPNRGAPISASLVQSLPTFSRPDQPRPNPDPLLRSSRDHPDPNCLDKPDHDRPGQPNHDCLDQPRFQHHHALPSTKPRPFRPLPPPSLALHKAGITLILKVSWDKEGGDYGAERLRELFGRMEYGMWTENSRNAYNKWDAIARSTTQVFPGAWTAIFVYLDNVGIWNLRSVNLDSWYLGQETYIRISNPEDTSNKTQLPMPANALFCGQLKDKQKPQDHH